MHAALSGSLVDRLNVNWVFAGGYLLVVCGHGGDRMGPRVLDSVCVEDCCWDGVNRSRIPRTQKLLRRISREEHRGLANSVIASGAMLGPEFGMLFGGLLMARFGWRPFFVAMGLASLLWILPWIRWMPKNDLAVRRESTDAPNLLEFLGMRAAWGSCLGLFSYNYVSYFLITWLPFYLVRERHFSMEQMAKIGGIAYLLGAAFTTVSGWLSDRWIFSGATPTRVRKTFMGGGIAAAGILAGIAEAPKPGYCVAAVILSIIFIGVSASNVWAITQTLAGPKAAGRWTGFQNFAGNLSGMVAPVVTGFVLQKTGHFYWAFGTVTVIALIGMLAVVFVIGPIEQVHWGKRSQAQY